METTYGNAYTETYKIILVGDTHVGKTHILNRYVKGTLPENPTATVGVEFATRVVPLAVGGTVKAQIWDTAGQERYKSVTSAHYRRAAGALLIYDITVKSSFLNASRWLDDMRLVVDPDIVVMLVGNKLDLVENNPETRAVRLHLKVVRFLLLTYSTPLSMEVLKLRMTGKTTVKLVPTKTAKQYADSENLFFCESSAVSNVNIKHIFEELLQLVYNSRTRCRMSDSYDSGNVTARWAENRTGIQLSNKVHGKSVGPDPTAQNGDSLRSLNCCSI
ncbi:Rab11b [Cardiosporidium cionae]|uniref:Rab11b n=1 Tax=Cardiosporidium cionae TaxID=476202 RepID=A0ABQ7JC08_9APIC|nr:Rab11b [Cardiosporidium cionae]|eukprot:KAF8821429.1 Rab11b [Cardiosporidium cionae]